MEMVPDKSPSMSAAELQRQAQLRAQLQRDYRKLKLARLWQSIILVLRWAFTFSIGTALVVLIVINRNEITSFVAQKIKLITQHIHKNEAATPILNGALNHEKEVDEAAGK